MDFRKSDKLILGAVAVVFFVSSLILVFGVPRMFVSPDALANFVFSSEVAEFSRLHLFQPMNLALDDTLFPRSMISIEGQLVPISFVGLPVLYGLLGKLLGTSSIALFTPFIAVLALFAWRRVVQDLFSKRVALISTILLAVHPAWWYYSARGMMHNVLFVALTIFSVWFLVARPWAKYQWLNPACSGLLLGLAIFVRTSEIIWLFLGGLFVLGFLWSEIKWREVVIFGVSVMIALLPMFVINQSLYGNPISFGYTAQEAGQTTQVTERVADDGMVEVVSVEGEQDESLLPFGFSVRSVLKHVYQYGLGLFWWMSLLTLIGLVLVVVNLRSKKVENARVKLLFHVLFIAIGAWLAIVYGSWTFTDNPDPTSVTIANSYVRYWLPVFVMTTVYAALAIDWLHERIRSQVSQKVIVIALLIVIAGLGIRGTFFAPDDGLLSIRENLIRSNEIKEQVLELTEEDAVIVVDHGDKIFFPERVVRYPLRDETTYDLMPRIVLRNALYYYGITFPDYDMEYLNGRKLAELGLQIELVQTFDEESLYRIYQP